MAGAVVMTQHRRAPIRRLRYSLSDRPFIVIWELTRACDLACRHCRADAHPDPWPGELSTGVGLSLVWQVANLGRPRPVFVMTGGDPLKREDLVELVKYSSTNGLPPAIAPSVTPLLTAEAITSLRQAGMSTLSLSLDGSTAEIHDGFRGIPGSFEESISAIETAKSLGIRVQVNTTVTPHDYLDLARIAHMVRAFEPVAWSVFFLVPTGRGVDLGHLSAEVCEDLLHFLYDVGKEMPVKVTEAPHYRRVVIQRQILEEKGSSAHPGGGSVYHALRLQYRELSKAGMLPDGPMGTFRPTAAAGGAGHGKHHPNGGSGNGGSRLSIKRSPLAVSSSRGFVFVSHTGEVYPSGFMPISCGNVRDQSLLDIYRDSPMLQALRDPRKLLGRCGLCEFREICGGSRSRAFGVTGNPFAEEPWCNYEPGSFPDQERIRDIVENPEL